MGAADRGRSLISAAMTSGAPRDLEDIISQSPPSTSRAHARRPWPRPRPKVTQDDDPLDAYDPATHTFDGLHLHQFMIRGEWNVSRLAEASGRSDATVRSALNERRVTQATAGALVRVLRNPYRHGGTPAVPTGSP